MSPQRPFEEVVAEHGPVVMRVVRALLPAADADDAWSETFVAALRRYPELRPGSDVRAWLVTIAHRKAIDRLRAAGRSARPVADPEVRLVAAGAGCTAAPRAAASAEAEAEAAALGDGLRGALAALPPKQRGAVVYRYLADLPYAVVAGLLGCSEAAARRSAADGIAALRRRLTEEDG